MAHFSGSIFLVLVQWNIIGLIMLYQILSFFKPLSLLISCLLWSSLFSYLWLILAFCKSTPADPGDKVLQKNTTKQTNLQSRPLRRSNCPWVTLLPSSSISAQQPALRPPLHTSLAWPKLRNGDILSGPYKWGKLHSPNTYEFSTLKAQVKQTPLIPSLLQKQTLH